MKNLTIQSNIAKNLIEKFEDLSDINTKRLRITFKNGYGISIIRGNLSYGGRYGLFEIAPISKSGNLDGSLFDKEDSQDDVLGYLDCDRVNYYIEKIANL